VRHVWRVDRFESVYMKAAVCPLAARKAKSFVHGKIPFPKEAHVDRCMHIHRASAVPIYLQIPAHLRNGILQGRFRFSVRGRSRANWTVHER
jgi:hypothetical protein